MNCPHNPLSRCQHCGKRFRDVYCRKRKFCSRSCFGRAWSEQRRAAWAPKINAIRADYLGGVSIAELAPRLSMTAVALNFMVTKWIDCGLLPRRPRPTPRQKTVAHAPKPSPFAERAPWPAGLHFEDARVPRLGVTRIASSDGCGARSSMGGW